MITPNAPASVALRAFTAKPHRPRSISAILPATAPAFENGLFKLVMSAPEYSVKDMMAFGAGLKFSAAALLHEMMTLELSAYGPTFELPVVLIEGELDRINPTALAVEWFETLRAPNKQLVIVRGVGHNSMLSRGDAFLHELRERVRPLAMAPPLP